MKRINHEESIRRYPRGCVYCGHDVAYLSDQARESGPESHFQLRPRRVEKLAEPLPMCPSCAKGGRHHRKCRGCQF